MKRELGAQAYSVHSFRFYEDDPKDIDATKHVILCEIRFDIHNV